MKSLLSPNRLVVTRLAGAGTHGRSRVGRAVFPLGRAWRLAAALALVVPAGSLVSTAAAADKSGKFQIEEATIADIQGAILKKQLTATALVKMYLARIKAY